MSLNYDLETTLNLFIDSLKYNVMLSIIFSSIVLCIICILNNKLSKYILFGINIVLLFLIGKYYMNDILTMQFSNPINNIYFYFLMSTIFIFIFTILLIKEYIDNYDYIIYSIFLIFISFSLFMTHYLNNVTIVVIGNIYPMIKFGNVLMLVYSIVLLTKLGYHVIIKTTSKRSGRL